MIGGQNVLTIKKHDFKFEEKLLFKNIRHIKPGLSTTSYSRHQLMAQLSYNIFREADPENIIVYLNSDGKYDF